MNLRGAITGLGPDVLSTVEELTLGMLGHPDEPRPTLTALPPAPRLRTLTVHASLGRLPTAAEAPVLEELVVQNAKVDSLDELAEHESLRKLWLVRLPARRLPSLNRLNLTELHLHDLSLECLPDVDASPPAHVVSTSVSIEQPPSDSAIRYFGLPSTARAVRELDFVLKELPSVPELAARLEAFHSQGALEGIPELLVLASRLYRDPEHGEASGGTYWKQRLTEVGGPIESAASRALPRGPWVADRIGAYAAQASKIDGLDAVLFRRWLTEALGAPR